jgi:hypothetical protein
MVLQWHGLICKYSRINHRKNWAPSAPHLLDSKDLLSCQNSLECSLVLSTFKLTTLLLCAYQIWTCHSRHTSKVSNSLHKTTINTPAWNHCLKFIHLALNLSRGRLSQTHDATFALTTQLKKRQCELECVPSTIPLEIISIHYLIVQY